MKIRTDYVTNSSSSSFIVAYRIPEYDEEILQKYPVLQVHPFLINTIIYSEDDIETTKGRVFRSKESYTDDLIDRWRNRPLEEILQNQFVKAEYDKIISLFEKGYFVFKKDVSFHNDIYNLIREFAEDNEDFIIIGEDE